jgi:16S rRNA C967 or C1407 C5-methylase (RsmB/RsmF family)
MSSIQLPAAFESQMISLLGEQAFEKFKLAVNQPAQTSIRLNEAKGYLPTWPKSPIDWSQQGFRLEERPSFTLDPAFHAGAYYVQEASSMFLQHAINQLIPGSKQGLKVLDLCAAPGGKTTLLASIFSEGLVVSNEVIKSRAAILVENTTKWGLPNMVVTNNDPEHFKDFAGYFDVIIVDAPCSGSGLFRN